MDRDRTLDAITREARGTRRSPSRALWIVASLVGVVCAIAFVVVVFADATPGPTPPPPAGPGNGLGFSLGLVIGLVAGIALGIAIARQRDHSSRSSP